MNIILGSQSSLSPFICFLSYNLEMQSIYVIIHKALYYFSSFKNVSGVNQKSYTTHVCSGYQYLYSNAICSV